jgi:hypothetical protein
LVDVILTSGGYGAIYLLIGMPLNETGHQSNFSHHLSRQHVILQSIMFDKLKQTHTSLASKAKNRRNKLNAISLKNRNNKIQPHCNKFLSSIPQWKVPISMKLMCRLKWSRALVSQVNAAYLYHLATKTVHLR